MPSVDDHAVALLDDFLAPASQIAPWREEQQ